MPFTGSLGSGFSQPGNILLGGPGVNVVQVTAAFAADSSIQANPTAQYPLSLNFSGDSSLTASEVSDPFYVYAAALTNSNNGILVVHFNLSVRIDSVLLNPASYTITGPSSITITDVFTVGPATIAILASGYIGGTYTVTCSTSILDLTAVHNLVVPTNQATFLSITPYSIRTLFTDNGPIVKPELVLQQGSRWSVQSTPTTFFGTVTLNEVTCPGASFNSNHIGLYIRLEAAPGVTDIVNGGSYKILKILSSIRLKVLASFRPPLSDPSNNLITNAWTLFDPRTGFIANNPSDVVVKVNGTPVGVDKVVGLLGEVVLTDPPVPTDVVTVDYFWIPDPTVEVRRLNSPEFRLNNWNNTKVNTSRKGFYSYRNVLQHSNGSLARLNKAFGSGTTTDSTLSDPSADFVTFQVIIGDSLVITSGVNLGTYPIIGVGTTTLTILGSFTDLALTTVSYRIPGRDDIRADLHQPLLREMFYRAYERAYLAALNDPTLLRLNTPKHRISYSLLSRQISQVTVAYSASTLPESDPTAPWVREGTGTAALSGGSLVVIGNTTGPFPHGSPFYWTRGVDLTFPHAYASTWRMQINSTTPDGVFTGVATGWSDNTRAVVLGFLFDGGVRKVGFLLRGHGNDPSGIAGWSGGIDSFGNPTGLPFDFDWSTIHSYRLFRDTGGVVRFYVDGEIIENLRISEDQLPFLEELDDSFNEVQNVFFGSLSREATSQSTWDFVDYLVLPTNPLQSTPSSFVSYVSTVTPEDASNPWTPIGYHGTETLITVAGNPELILDSTSATDLATEAEVGLIGGDFRGYTRIEPLLSVSTDVVLDFELHLRTLTHGIAANAVMAAIDDGKHLVQVCFFSSSPQPKVSYPGRSLPQDATPRPWTPLGGASATMIGRTLRITDTSSSDGLVYAIEDLELPSSPNRIFATGIDYMIESRFTVVFFTPDGTAENFCGATMDVFDGLKTLGLMIRRNPLSPFQPQVALHSDGITIGSSIFNFNWNDGLPHTYRVTKDTLGDLVSLFIDTVFVGSCAYSLFTSVFGTPTLSFGSSTANSSLSHSVVDWDYSNGWRSQPLSGVRHYVGIWKGTDSNRLLGYYLPLKARGTASTVGNTLTDLLADFVADSVQVGDDLVIDYGVNRGIYSVLSVSDPNTILIDPAISPFPQTGQTVVDYRIPTQTEWALDHTYQLIRDPAGFVALFLDSSTIPLIRVEYNPVTLPLNSVGIPNIINRGLPSVTWGAFDPTNLSQTAWTFLQYGITRSPVEVKAVPPHQVLNQRNVMASPEHLFGTVMHNHTQYSSSSTGVPFPWDQFVNNPSVHAFTQLNEGTPLVPATQTFDIRKKAFSSFPPFSDTGFGGSSFGTDGFGFGAAGAIPSLKVTFSVPVGVLYNKLQVIEKDAGDLDLLSAFSDEVTITFNPPVVSISVNLAGDSGIDANTL